jgi:hypothetical protein
MTLKEGIMDGVKIREREKQWRMREIERIEIEKNYKWVKSREGEREIGRKKNWGLRGWRSLRERDRVWEWKW